MNKERLKTRIVHEKEDFPAYVKELLEFNRLDGDAVIGIAKKIAAEGIENLSPLQMDTFIKHGLLPYLYVEECERCHEDIPWSEMDAALDDGFCSYCRHKEDKGE